MSELMEESSILIDEAFDLAAQGKISEAVEKYKKAYEELEKLEFQYPDRAATSEFSTVRNKKAYVSTSIDSLLLKQASENARAVAVTDTTELEKRYEAEMKAKAAGLPVEDEDDEPEESKSATKENAPSQHKKAEGVNEAAGAPARNAAAASERRGKIAKIAAENPANRKAKIMLAVEDLKNGEFNAAELTIKELLAEKPNDVTALNLKAAVEAARGDYEKAKSTLHQLIQSNPKDHSGYYNLAKLIIKFEGADGKAAARRYYDTARKYYGGPKDAKLEELLK